MTPRERAALYQAHRRGQLEQALGPPPAGSLPAIWTGACWWCGAFIAAWIDAAEPTLEAALCEPTCPGLAAEQEAWPA